MGIFDFFWNHAFASIVGAFGVITYGLGVAEQAHAIVTRFKAWQLQAVGAAFFAVAVVMVLADFEQARGGGVAQSAPTKLPAEARPDPNVLPQNIAAEYEALMSQRHTKLQEQGFFKRNAGKKIDLSLELISIEKRNASLWGQFYADSNPSVFVTFAPDWEDYLMSKNAGDVIAFRAKIVGDEDTGFTLGEAYPL